LSAADLVVGRPYVLRGLVYYSGKWPIPRPPAVALLEKIEGDEITVRLHVRGGRRFPWAPQKRIATVANVAREATRREVVLGHPVEPLPARAS
jgi:hypothetical protein